MKKRIRGSFDSLLKRLEWSYHYKMVGLGIWLFRDWNVRCELCRIPKRWNFIQYVGRLRWCLFCGECGMGYCDEIMKKAQAEK